MKSACFAIAFSLLAAGGCASNGESEEEAAVSGAVGGAEAAAAGAVVEPGVTPGSVAADDMPADCVGRAAAEFNVPFDDIRIAPTDTSGGIYTILGQYPPEGEDVNGFQCQFDPAGKFISIIPLDRPSSSPS